MGLSRRIERWRNPGNLTAIHLSQLVRQRRATVGPHTYGKPKVRFANGGLLSIGDYCSFADDVTIFLGGNHRLDFVSTFPFHNDPSFRENIRQGVTNVCSGGNVSIGSDVWIASGVRIYSGVKIGNGAAIAGGAHVTRDVADYAVVAGNPAIAKRLRFSGEVVSALLETAWWTLPEADVKRLAPLIEAGDITEFLRQISILRRS